MIGGSFGKFTVAKGVLGVAAFLGMSDSGLGSNTSTSFRSTTAPFGISKSNQTSGASVSQTEFTTSARSLSTGTLAETSGLFTPKSGTSSVTNRPANSAGSGYVTNGVPSSHIAMTGTPSVTNQSWVSAPLTYQCEGGSRNFTVPEVGALSVVSASGQCTVTSGANSKVFAVTDIRVGILGAFCKLEEFAGDGGSDYLGDCNEIRLSCAAGDQITVNGVSGCIVPSRPVTSTPVPTSHQYQTSGTIYSIGNFSTSVVDTSIFGNWTNSSGNGTVRNFVSTPAPFWSSPMAFSNIGDVTTGDNETAISEDTLASDNGTTVVDGTVNQTDGNLSTTNSSRTNVTQGNGIWTAASITGVTSAGILVLAGLAKGIQMVLRIRTQLQGAIIAI